MRLADVFVDICDCHLPLRVSLMVWQEGSPCSLDPSENGCFEWPGVSSQDSSQVLSGHVFPTSWFLEPFAIAFLVTLILNLGHRLDCISEVSADGNGKIVGVNVKHLHCNVKDQSFKSFMRDRDAAASASENKEDTIFLVILVPFRQSGGMIDPWEAINVILQDDFFIRRIIIVTGHV